MSFGTLNLGFGTLGVIGGGVAAEAELTPITWHAVNITWHGTAITWW